MQERIFQELLSQFYGILFFFLSYVLHRIDSVRQKSKFCRNIIIGIIAVYRLTTLNIGSSNKNSSSEHFRSTPAWYGSWYVTVLVTGS